MLTPAVVIFGKLPILGMVITSTVLKFASKKVGILKIALKLDASTPTPEVTTAVPARLLAPV